MKWIRSSERLPPRDSGPVLIVYLDTFFGKFIPRQTVGYYDDPLDYQKPQDGEGWKVWSGDRGIAFVTHWKPLGEFPSGEFMDMNQEDFQRRFRTHLGTVIEKTYEA